MSKIFILSFPIFISRYWTKSSVLWGISVKIQISHPKMGGSIFSWKMNYLTSPQWPWSTLRNTLNQPSRRSPTLVLTFSTLRLLPVSTEIEFFNVVTSISRLFMCSTNKETFSQWKYKHPRQWPRLTMLFESFGCRVLRVGRLVYGLDRSSDWCHRYGFRHTGQPASTI